MMNPKNNLVFAAGVGSLVVILTYAVTYMTAGEGDFWLSLILGAAMLVIFYLIFFFHGLRFAAALDEYEKTASPYDYKAPALVRGWDGLGASGMVYLAPETLILVWRKRGKLQTLCLSRQEIIQIIPGKEDLELLLTEGRILSLDWGAEEEGTQALLKFFSPSQQDTAE